MIRKFLSDLRKEFKESNKIIKIAELKKMEQESKIIKELENKYTSKYQKGTTATIITALILAKETRDTVIDVSRACSNGKSNMVMVYP